MVHINSWDFDFRRMEARDKRPYLSNGQKIGIRFNGEHIQRWCVVRGWVQFFDEPENDFNAKIDKAYHAYVDEKFEKEVLG